MKKLLIVVTAVLVLAFGITGCSQTQTTPKPDIPRYTADQVIAVGQANSPSIPRNYPQITHLSWSAQYLGKGIWIVKKSGLGQLGNNLGQLEAWYFHEKDGQLNKSNVP